MTDYFYIGDYDLHIWLAYGLTCIVMIINIVVPLLNEKQLARKLSGNITKYSKGKN